MKEVISVGNLGTPSTTGRNTGADGKYLYL